VLRFPLIFTIFGSFIRLIACIVRIGIVDVFVVRIGLIVVDGGVGVVVDRVVMNAWSDLLQVLNVVAADVVHAHLNIHINFDLFPFIEAVGLPQGVDRVVGH